MSQDQGQSSGELAEDSDLQALAREGHRTADDPEWQGRYTALLRNHSKAEIDTALGKVWGASITPPLTEQCPRPVDGQGHCKKWYNNSL